MEVVLTSEGDIDQGNHLLSTLPFLLEDANILPLISTAPFDQTLEIVIYLIRKKRSGIFKKVWDQFRPDQIKTKSKRVQLFTLILKSGLEALDDLNLPSKLNLSLRDIKRLYQRGTSLLNHPESSIDYLSKIGGIDPNREVYLRQSIEYEDQEVLRTLLKYSRGNSSRYNRLLFQGIQIDSPLVVGILLTDSRWERPLIISGHNKINDPLILAVNLNRVEAVKVLLQNSRIDPSIQDNSPLMTAIENGRLQIAWLILQNPRFRISMDKIYQADQLSQKVVIYPVQSQIEMLESIKTKLKTIRNNKSTQLKPKWS